MARTILIVDDGAGFRRLARTLLESEGYRVVGEAPDGDSAVRAARELGPDVVLLDVHLPDCTGFDLTPRLADAQPDAAIIITSTHEGAEFEGLARRSGARGFVPKAELSVAAIGALLG
ncbi:MAG TPA: response regulator transcription factor [Thermoleophilaceae bacterium]|jgi:DNA-binding NarL/FixJ family response regulator